jgi:hypothetical protein
MTVQQKLDQLDKLAAGGYRYHTGGVQGEEEGDSGQHVSQEKELS